MRPSRERLENAYHALPIPLHSKQLLINWGVIAIGLLSLYGFTAISLIIVARSVSKFEYGQYLAVFSLATLTVVAALVRHGLMAAHPRARHCRLWPEFLAALPAFAHCVAGHLVSRSGCAHASFCRRRPSPQS